MRKRRCSPHKSTSRHSRPRAHLQSAEIRLAQAYVLISGKVQVTTVDEDQQEVVVDEPGHGDFFGFASMLEQTPHQTSAVALEETECIEVSRDDIATLLERKPHAGMDLLDDARPPVSCRAGAGAIRANRNANEIIEEEETLGERIADSVAAIRRVVDVHHHLFGVILSVYTRINILLGQKAWDPYPFILLNLFLSMLAAIQAPVIMMSQNRQDTKDRVRSELDFDVNRRAESEIQALARKLNLLDEKIDDFGDLLRARENR